MSADSNATTASQHQPFVITRTFAAPRALVFQAWTETERLAQWWGPKGMTLAVATLDFRPGGQFHYSMTGPDGQVMWGKFVYHEIVAPERLVWANSFADEAGNIIRAPFFDGKWPLEIMNTATFTEADGKTTITISGFPHNATEAECLLFVSNQPSMQVGFGGTFDQLDAYLATLAKLFREVVHSVTGMGLFSGR